MAETMDKGCIPGNCSYRPEDPAEQARIKRRREALRAPAQGAPEAKQYLDLAATFENAKRVTDYNPAIRELQSDFTFFDDECKLIAKALRHMAGATDGLAALAHTEGDRKTVVRSADELLRVLKFVFDREEHLSQESIDEIALVLDDDAFSDPSQHPSTMRKSPSDGEIYATLSQRNITPEETALIEKAIRDSGEVLYDVEPSPVPRHQSGGVE